ncbi:MAG: SGNH/GDSL hydrolase family protein [Candidatus Hodarchaeota archaeon]
MDFTIEQLKPYIHGLVWFGVEDYKLIRFPTSKEDSLDPHLWDMSVMTSGVRIRFRTRCEVIGLEFSSIRGNENIRLPPLSKRGFDLYADGEYINTVIAPETRGEFYGWFDVDPREEHDYEIYFPYQAEVVLEGMFLEFKRGNEEPEIKPATPFAVEDPVVFYGSSITHGGDAQRSGLIYPVLIARELNVDLINLGFGGAGKGGPEVADLLASIPRASAYVMDWGINIWGPDEVDLIYERYQPMLDKIKAAHPDVPILIVNIQGAGPKWGPEARLMQENLQKIRDEIKKCYDGEVKKGNKTIRYIDGRDIISLNDLDLTVDRVHPNQAGFFRYALKLTPILRDMLKL